MVAARTRSLWSKSLKREMNKLKEAFLYVYQLLVDLPDTCGIAAENFHSTLAYILLRELFHFAGGAFIVLVSVLISDRSWNHFYLAFAGTALFVLMLLSELLQYRNGQTLKKTILDLVAWFSGYAMGVVTVLHYRL